MALVFIMEERILKFISEHRLMTLATADGEGPYCCNVFYVFDQKSGNLFFMSAADTKHVSQAIRQPKVAGTIVSSDVNIARLKGIQFTGIFFKPADSLLEQAKRIYMKKFPLAHFIESSIWCIELDYIKMTDNTLGFGKKISWSREKEMQVA